jgi:hypothetical protein
MKVCFARVGERQGVFAGFVVGVAVQDDLGAEVADRLILIAGVVLGHDDGGAQAQHLRAASATPWAWLPADAVMTPRVHRAKASGGHLVVGAAQLEGKHRLHVLALQYSTSCPDAAKWTGA